MKKRQVECTRLPFPFSVDSVITYVYQFKRWSSEIPHEVKIRDEQKKMLQLWDVSNGIYNTLLHDKKTGFDTFLFEKDVDGKKQVVVFRRRDIR